MSEDFLDGLRLRKTIAAVHGENTTLVLYELEGAPPPSSLRDTVSLDLRPFLTWRDCHALGTSADLSETVKLEERTFKQFIDWCLLREIRQSHQVSRSIVVYPKLNVCGSPVA